MEYILALIGVSLALLLVKYCERKDVAGYSRWQDDPVELERFVRDCRQRENAERKIATFYESFGDHEYSIYTAKEQIESYFADDEASKLKCLEILEENYFGSKNYEYSSH